MVVRQLQPQIPCPHTSVQSRRDGAEAICLVRLCLFLFWRNSFPADFPLSVIDHNCVSGPFFFPRKGGKVRTGGGA